MRRAKEERDTPVIRLRPPGGGALAAAWLERAAAALATARGAGVRIAQDQIVIHGLADSEAENLLAVFDGDVRVELAGPTVRGPTSCWYCHLGQQDPLPLAGLLERSLTGRRAHAKTTITIDGCRLGCAGSVVSDIGLQGAPDGWHILVGGRCGPFPRLADRLWGSTILPEDAVVDALRAVLEAYDYFGRDIGPGRVQKDHLGDVIERVGLDEFQRVVEETLPDHLRSMVRCAAIRKGQKVAQTTTTKTAST